MKAAKWEKQQKQVLEYIEKQNDNMINETKRKEEASLEKFDKLEKIIESQREMYRYQMEENKIRLFELRTVLDEERRDRQT